MPRTNIPYLDNLARQGRKYGHVFHPFLVEKFGEKYMKIQLFSQSGLWYDLQKFLRSILIFLRSLMPKKSRG